MTEQERALGAPAARTAADVTERHFVTFFSPGTFFEETDDKAIDRWDVLAALKMAAGIKQRYGAKPFGFRFETRLVSTPVDDGRGGKLNVEPRTVRASGMHYIDGKLLTLADVEAHKDYGPGSALASNMRCNKMAHVVETRNSYRHVAEFRPSDWIVNSKTGALSGAKRSEPAEGRPSPEIPAIPGSKG